MFRRSPRVFYFVVVFFLSLTTLNFLNGNQNQLKSYLRWLIANDEIKSLVDNPLTLVNVRIYPEVTNYELKDWQDYKFIAYEASRSGPGENGTAVVLTDPGEIEINQKLFAIEGLNAYVSDKISVNRSLPDVRHKKQVKP